MAHLHILIYVLHLLLRRRHLVEVDHATNLLLSLNKLVKFCVDLVLILPIVEIKERRLCLMTETMTFDIGLHSYS